MFCTIFFDIFNINPENFQVSVQSQAIFSDVCVEIDESEQNDYWTDNGLYYAKKFVFYAPCILRIPDNSDAETFTDKFFNNILEDSDEEECSIKTIDNSSDDLTLEVGMTFFTWKSAYDYIKRWSLQQGFFIRQGRCVKVENERRKQTIVCNCEGIYNNEAKKNKNKPSKTH
ncbi:hypothetical protein RhiirB3_441816 [Rhizophagus irregularis]|nr:hypothetical protein RhiirB3_441816 [Rhizophagus irregularis]